MKSKIKKTSLYKNLRWFRNSLKRLKLIPSILVKSYKTPSMYGSGAVTFCGDGFLTTRPYGDFDQTFLNLYQESLTRFVPEDFKSYSYTLWRAHYYNTFALNSLNIEGDFVELGVWYGSNAYPVCHNPVFLNSGKKFHLVDAFGFSNDEIKKFGKKSKYEVDILSAVKKRFEGTNAVIHRGFVPEIFAEIGEQLPQKISFLSMDLNDVRFEKAGIEFLWDRISIGGFIYLDDYGCQGYSATQKFYDDFAKEKSCRILKTPFSCAILQKIAE